MVPKDNSGTYYLAQFLDLGGVNFGASNFQFGGTSQVYANPEPSSLVIAGIGALGMIGYGLRQRRVLGATATPPTSRLE